MIYLDTHAVVWMYAGEIERFPRTARLAIEAEELLISPLVVLEMQYLRETGRLTEAPQIVCERLAREIGLHVREVPMLEVVQESMLQTWTRDPFDRMIVGQCVVDATPLLTKDRTIRRHFKQARWD